jgi:hypothetical protein
MDEIHNSADETLAPAGESGFSEREAMPTKTGLDSPTGAAVQPAGGPQFMPGDLIAASRWFDLLLAAEWARCMR